MGRGGEGGVAHGAALVRFGEAVTLASEDAGQARADLLARVGKEAFVEAACIVAIFNGLVRTADASGIPLDEGTRAATAGYRGELGLEEYGSASNTDLKAPVNESNLPLGMPKLMP